MCQRKGQRKGQRKEGEVLELEISDLSRGGAGVARTAKEHAEVFFVPHTAPGDRVRARITELNRKWIQTELLEVLSPSTLRIEPKCPYFGKCGGCEWQHLPYDYQWSTKVSGVKHALNRVSVYPDTGLWEDRFEEFPAEKIWEYRNRVQLRGFRDALGFYAGGTHQIVPIHRCEIARPEINRELHKIREEGRKYPREYKVELAVSSSGRLLHAWNSRHSATGFRQVHDEQNAKMQTWISGQFEAGMTDRGVLDLYGGSGNLSQALVGRVPVIHCVDISVPKRGAEDEVSGVTYHASPVLPWLQNNVKMLSEAPSGWDVILDPPRIGVAEDLGKMAALLKDAKVRMMIAVGCDPDAWARDLSRWLKSGWVLERVAVFDFFPQTPHIESVARLRLSQ